MENRQQIQEWNGAQGEAWVRWHDETEQVVAAFGAAALAVADPRPGERVLDVGCGCGTTTFELARRVGPEGHVLGIDVSRPMLEEARRRAEGARLPHIAFTEGDAARTAFPTDRDLSYSRFGTMFFDDPVAAFRHLRTALRPGGRVVWLAWRTPRDNPWATMGVSAARAALGVAAPPTDPNAPGPFALADEDRARTLMIDAGYVDVRFERRDRTIPIGASAADAAQRMLHLGPTARFAREQDPARIPEILAAVQAALMPLADATGAVHATGSAWIIHARNPA